MTRSLSILSVLLLLIGSTGCRMCGSSYDYCIPAHIDRTEDYRGCDSLYRAGSVFLRDGSCNEEYISEDGQIIRGTNAGNYGFTTPIEQNLARPNRLEPRKGGSGGSNDATTIGIPPQAPVPNSNNPESTLPGIEDLMKGNIPSSPAPQPMNPPLTRHVPNETVPFMAQSGEPTITVEELRRLDPSATDIKILNVEDSVGLR